MEDYGIFINEQSETKVWIRCNIILFVAKLELTCVSHLFLP